MCRLWRQHKDWESDLSVIRGHRSRYYQQFKGLEEILLDCVAHERDDAKSTQCVVDFLMQRWRNPLTEQEAFVAARQFVEESKNHAAHWATWISPSLLTYSTKKLTPRPPPMPNIWRQDHIKETSTPQPQSRLLSLPAEVRIQILSYAVQPSRTTTPFADPSHERGIIIGTKASLHPPLSVTCRQLRHETLPIFYSTNTFIFFIDTFPALSRARTWLSYLTDKYVSHLQNILFLGFDRVSLLHMLGMTVPHGVAMALGGMYELRPVRLAMNLRSLTMELETEVPNGEDWLVRWEEIMQHLRDCLKGMEVGEAHLNAMVGEFGRGVEDLGHRGRRVEWFA